jgi:HAD superfamily hydrolase (TIGR01490 family)
VSHGRASDFELPELNGRLQQARRLAFFDVDGTIIAGKSMPEFWDYWCQVHGPAVPAAVPALCGADRVAGARAYGRRFAGIPDRKVRQLAPAWYGGYKSGPAPFLTAAVRAFRAHQRDGDGVVLVSGSLQNLVAPIAEDLDADLAICTEQLLNADGLLTGEVHRPMVGEAKREALTELVARLAVPARDCFAYGDHASDLPMLESVGTPVVVGGDPVLLERALCRGWLRLEPVAGPLPFVSLSPSKRNRVRGPVG